MKMVWSSVHKKFCILSSGKSDVICNRNEWREHDLRKDILTSSVSWILLSDGFYIPMKITLNRFWNLGMDLRNFASSNSLTQNDENKGYKKGNNMLQHQELNFYAPPESDESKFFTTNLGF